MDLDRLRSAANDPLGTLKARSEGSGRRLGLAFSSYFPLEVLDAFGLEGAWLPSLPKPEYPEAEAVMQAFVCNCVRSSVDAVLEGGLPVGLVAASTGCDSRLALATILRTAGVGAPVIMLRLPVSVGSDAATRQGADALAAFIEEAGKALGREMDPDMLAEAGSSRQKGREILSDLFDGLGNGGPAASSVYAAAVASQVMEPGEFVAALSAEGTPNAADDDGVRCMLSGSSIPSPHMIDDLEGLGVRIVADDTCTGTRAACRRTPDGEGDLAGRIGTSLIQRPLHGPTMMEPGHDRIRHVVESCRTRDVKAVIMLHYKFCDPHAFEAPGLVRALDDAGIRSLILEVDRDPGLTSRERTRVETLLEAIR